MAERPPVLVTHYTDPWSVWCWAMTPVPRDFPRDDIVRMFHAAKRQSGMPLDADLVLKVHSGTTHRAGIAAKAVALPGGDRAFGRRGRLRVQGSDAMTGWRTTPPSACSPWSRMAS
ncbi:MAG: hypothetical protein WDA16_05645 [Candidatus Thermoplasmatota archaeon]